MISPLPVNHLFFHNLKQTFNHIIVEVNKSSIIDFALNNNKKRATVTVALFLLNTCA